MMTAGDAGPAKCALHAKRLEDIEHRLGRLEEDLEAVIAEQNKQGRDAALASQAIELFRGILDKLSDRVDALSGKLESMGNEVHGISQDRWKLMAGLLGNGAIGATSIGILLWALEHVK